MLHTVRHPDALEHFLHALLALRRRQAAIRERQLDVLENREIADQIERLENETDFAIADARAIGERKIRHRLFVDPVVAVRRRIEQAENRKQGGFAATRRSGDGEKFAVLDIEVHATESMGLYLVGVEDFRHAFEANQGLCVAIHSVLLRYQTTNDGAEMFPPTSIALDQNCPRRTCRRESPYRPPASPS